jgi:hypothetical protein
MPECTGLLNGNPALNQLIKPVVDKAIKGAGLTIRQERAKFLKISG